MSLRLAVAKQAGVDETTIDKVARYWVSDLDEPYKVALRFADALMTQPGDVDPRLRDHLREHFSPKQILELSVDVMKWNYQKVAVALGTDEQVNPDRLTELRFDEDGHEVYDA